MIIKYSDLTAEKLNELIEEQKNFEVTDFSDMSTAVKFLESKIESKGLSCRIYTFGRVAAAGGSLFGGLTGILGVGSAIGMAVHNLATLDPHYEIAKHIASRKLSVKRCK